MKFSPAATLVALVALMACALPAWADNALIAAGPFHTCALAANGSVQCWGDNSNGELGVGSASARAAPVQVAGLGTGMQAVAAKGDFSCALTAAGAVRCWGNNNHGQLGDGTTLRRFSPITVTGLGSGVKAIAPGDSHTCALTTAGAVRCWGNNSYGQLGDGTTTQRLTPVAVAGLGSGVRAIASGGNHTCAVTTAGAVFCWGENIAGQLGDGTMLHRDAPVLVTGLDSGVQAISLGYYHSCALSTAGAVSCWGYAAVGSVGDGTTGDANHDRLTPVAVVGLASGVSAIAAGYEHTCALTTAGAVQCWGWNLGGQLGDGTKVQRLGPVPVAGLSSGVQALAAGVYHSCALVTVGSVYCWGQNGVMQLGDGTTTERLAPVAVVFRSVLARSDFNGDGLSDILWRNISNGANTIWKSANATLLQAVTSASQPLQVAGTGDFNADGITDILWRNTATGANVIWKSANEASKATVTSVTNLDWQIVGVADFDGDGTADILWRNARTGANTIWKTATASTTQAVVGVTNVDWHVVAVGDFNSDGRADIFWRNSATGANAIWYSANAATSVSVMGVTNRNWTVVGVGDFDGDGAFDLLWHERTTGASAIWKSGNAATQQAVTTVTNLEWTIAAVGDYNGDGKSDVLWHNTANGANVIWRSALFGSPQDVAGVTDTSWNIVGK